MHKVGKSELEDPNQSSPQAGLVNRLYSIERETNRFKVCLEANLVVLAATEAWYISVSQFSEYHDSLERRIAAAFEGASRSTHRQICRLDFISRDAGIAMEQVSLPPRLLILRRLTVHRQLESPMKATPARWKAMRGTV